MFNFFKKSHCSHTAKKEPKNLKEVLSRFKDLEDSFEKLSKELRALKKENTLNIKKIGIARFNPFKEVGGDQSFSVAILDGNDSGVIITSLFTREGNRVYGKPVKNGRSEYLLSEEEKEAIARAQSSGNSNFQNSNPK